MDQAALGAFVSAMYRYLWPDPEIDQEWLAVEGVHRLVRAAVVYQDQKVVATPNPHTQDVARALSRLSCAVSGVYRDPRTGGLWSEHSEEECAAQANLIRELFSNPSRAVPAIDPPVRTWNAGTVVRLAEAAYEDRVLPAGTFRLDRVAVLADALEEAGCTNADILAHCRGPGPHVRGCWVVDLLLSKDR
jgi:hypothetical protein